MISISDRNVQLLILFAGAMVCGYLVRFNKTQVVLFDILALAALALFIIRYFNIFPLPI